MNLYLFIYFCVFGISLALYRQSNIVFKDNGYSNILLAIHDSITDETIVDKIKAVFVKASKFLYSASRQRAFFKDITIVVPATWKDGPSISLASTGQTLQYADIIVSGPRSSHRNYPLTRSYAGCGHPGINIQMTSDVFLHPNLSPVTNSPDKFIVHEWATFRWGVFNEYPNPGENPYYFSTAFGRPDPIRCAIGLIGRMAVRYPNGTTHTCSVNGPLDPVTGLLEHGCKYMPYPYHNRGNESLMDHQWIKEVVEFCDDRRDYHQSKFGHNFEPPNPQNRLCSHRSVWDVIENTEDFRDGKNQPRTISNVEPTFKIVKASRTKRTTLYIDDDNLRSNQLADYMIDMLSSDHVVQLHHSNKEMSHHLVKRATTKTHKIKVINIGPLQHLRIEIIKRGSQTGDHHIVIGCGSQNYNSKRKNGMINSGVFSLECEGEKVESKSSTSVFEVLHFLNDFEKGPVHIYHKTLYLKSGKVFWNSFIVDEYFEGSLSIRLSYDSEPKPVVVVTTPNGTLINLPSADDDLKIIHSSLAFPAKGQWKIFVSSKHPMGQDMRLYIDYTHNTSSSAPMRISAKAISRYYQKENRVVVFAEINQGHHPVLGLTVTANIHHNGSNIFQTDLYDNGAGADLHKNDGIYSRFLPYYKDLASITIEVSDPHRKGYILTTRAIPETDLNSDNGNIEYYQMDTPLKHGISRMTATNPVFHSPLIDSEKGIPPARIQDFKSLGINKDTIVNLEFTAPGDDLDHGSAHHYELLYAHTSQEIFDNRNSLDSLKRVQQSDLVKGSLLLPRRAGQPQELGINITSLAPQRNSFAFVIYAVDRDGNKGDMSNLVTAGIAMNP